MPDATRGPTFPSDASGDERAAWINALANVRVVADAVRFFLGPDSRNCYGAELTVDGGLNIPGAHGFPVQLR